jgi:hypothetical protein
MHATFFRNFAVLCAVLRIDYCCSCGICLAKAALSSAQSGQLPRAPTRERRYHVLNKLSQNILSQYIC